MRLILEDDDGERYELVKAPCGEDCCLHNDVCEHGFPGERLPCNRFLDFYDSCSLAYSSIYKRITDKE